VAAFVVLLLGTVVVRLAADEAAPAKTEEKTTEELASGLDIGQTLPAFNPTHVTGPDKGTNTCPV
jgi:hypothetical protein